MTLRGSNRIMSVSTETVSHQPRVERYFDSVAMQWRELYRGASLRSEVFSRRQSLALNWLAQQISPRDAHVLDVGCGAGPASVALAIRGAHVKAIDVTERMVNLTRKSAEEAGVSELVEAATGDIHSLKFAEGSFDAAVAIGLIYWLHSPQQALSELFRVLKPGGYLLVTADNAQRLTYLLDPGNLPPVIGVRRLTGSLLHSLGLRERRPTIKVNRYSLRGFDELLSACGFEKVKGMTVGFGPFSFFEKKFLHDAIGAPLHRSLQQMAESGNALFANRGNHYLVLARKPL